MSQIDSLRELLAAETDPKRIEAYEKQISYLEELAEEQTYRVVRKFGPGFGKESELIAEGLTLEEAQERCSAPDSGGKTDDGWEWMDVFYRE